MDKKPLFQLFEITTNIEGNISKEVIDVNIENTIIQAIDTFKSLFPQKAAYITDAQLVSGEGVDDLTIVLLGDRPDNIKKAFKIAFNLLSRNQRYAFSRTPDIIDTIQNVQNSSEPE